MAFNSQGGGREFQHAKNLDNLSWRSNKEIRRSLDKMLFLGAEAFDDGFVLTLCTKALYLVLVLSAPMLLSALSVGLLISIIQATTQVQEQTLSFVPKIIATFMSIVLCGNWMFNMLSSFTISTLADIARMGPK